MAAIVSIIHNVHISGYGLQLDASAIRSKAVLLLNRQKSPLPTHSGLVIRLRLDVKHMPV